ncbi:putative cyclin-D6-1 [Cornus florida]|uniref:putative cyclin-D6-1 n=1 Tax=Cornus florida TaxID=4283 RepID=UPI00289E9D4E|nr:putative cyclin-D6-1 [Cornus florida]XP_059623599.1 putative cyclin-D6-1 [Cornus florida]
MEFDLENPLMSFQEHQFDTISRLFANESDHMPSLSFKGSNFLASVRQEAISLILQEKFSCKFDSFTCYLAVNYIDRFISKQEIPQGKPWIARLLVISCLSVAAKMNTTEISLSELQREEGFIFNAQSINRMEVLVLNTLNWRMRSITPFSFLCFFLSLLELEDPQLSQGLRDRASEIIFKTHYEVKLLEYKPSLIAASALLCASRDLFPSQYTCFGVALFSCEYVDKEKLVKCSSVMQDMVMDGCDSVFDAVVSSRTKTPISVVDRHCKNTEREDTLMAERDNNNIKRPRLNGVCTDHAFHFSQIQRG